MTSDYERHVITFASQLVVMVDKMVTLKQNQNDVFSLDLAGDLPGCMMGFFSKGATADCFVIAAMLVEYYVKSRGYKVNNSNKYGLLVVATYAATTVITGLCLEDEELFGLTKINACDWQKMLFSLLHLIHIDAVCFTEGKVREYFNEFYSKLGSSYSFGCSSYKVYDGLKELFNTQLEEKLVYQFAFLLTKKVKTEIEPTLSLKPLKSQDVTPRTLEIYIGRCIKYLEINSWTVITAYLLLDRYAHKASKQLNMKVPHLLAIALIIAGKLDNDSPASSYWSGCAVGLTSDALNQGEKEFLKAIAWEVQVLQEDICKKYLEFIELVHDEQHGIDISAARRKCKLLI